MFTKFASMLGDGDSLSITITKKGDNLITSILPKKADLSDTGKTIYHLLWYQALRKSWKMDLSTL